MYYVFKNIYLESGKAVNGQFLQTEKGRLVVKVEGPMPADVRVLLERELEKYFDNDMDWDFEENAVIHTMEGKGKDFVSLVEDDHV